MLDGSSGVLMLVGVTIVAVAMIVWIERHLKRLS